MLARAIFATPGGVKSDRSGKIFKIKIVDIATLFLVAPTVMQILDSRLLTDVASRFGNIF